MSQLLRLRDRVLFEDVAHQVVATGTQVRLVADDGSPAVVLLSHLVGSPDFAFLAGDAEPARGVLAGHLLEDVAPELAVRAREWERHIVEVETGLLPGAESGARPRPEYNPQSRTMRERDAAKAAELTAGGTPTSATTVKRMRMRYRADTLRGLVDGRGSRRSTPLGRSDVRVVAVVREALAGEMSRSTGTVDRLRRQVEAILAERHGPGAAPLPSRATYPVLVGGGTPFFTALDSWVNLSLVETRTFPGGVVLSRYETRR